MNAFRFRVCPVSCSYLKGFSDGERGKDGWGPVAHELGVYPWPISEEDFDASRIPPETQTQLSVTSASPAPAAPFKVQMKPAQREAESNTSTDGVYPNQESLLSVPENEEYHSQIHPEALIMARKTFKGVEIASGSIPVVGGYVGAAAKVGLAFVEALQVG